MVCIPKYNPKIGDIVECITNVETSRCVYTKGHKFVISEFKGIMIFFDDMCNCSSGIKVEWKNFNRLFSYIETPIRKESDENLCPRCGKIVCFNRNY